MGGNEREFNVDLMHQLLELPTTFAQSSLQVYSVSPLSTYTSQVY